MLLGPCFAGAPRKSAMTSSSHSEVWDVRGLFDVLKFLDGNMGKCPEVAAYVDARGRARRSEGPLL